MITINLIKVTKSCKKGRVAKIIGNVKEYYYSKGLNTYLGSLTQTYVFEVGVWRQC